MSKQIQLTKNISNRIVDELMNGKPLTQVCQDKDLPSLTTVYGFIKDNKEFASQVLLARRISAQTYLDRMITELENADSKNIHVIREKLHHYRWMASKLIGIYGDKTQVNVDQQIEIKWQDPKVIDVKLDSIDKTNSLSRTT